MQAAAAAEAGVVAIILSVQEAPAEEEMAATLMVVWAQMGQLILAVAAEGGHKQTAVTAALVS